MRPYDSADIATVPRAAVRISSRREIVGAMYCILPSARQPQKTRRSRRRTKSLFGFQIQRILCAGLRVLCVSVVGGRCIYTS